jgi:hypothetical protein
MRTYISNLPPTTWIVLGLPALVVCRSLVTALVPWIAHAVVPQAVRAVLSVI